MKQQNTGMEPRIAVINAYTLIAVIYCASFTVLYDFEVNDAFLTVVHVISLVALIINYFALKKTGNFRQATAIILALGIVVVTSLFATGGWEKTGYLWIFAYLPFPFFLSERNVAKKWIAALFISCLSVVALHFLRILPIPYSSVMLINFFSALLVCVTCIFLSQKANVDYQEFLSAQKTAELNRSAELYTFLVNSSEDAIFTKSLDGNITSWNRGAEKIFGYAAEEVLGKNILMKMDPELEEEEKRILERVKQNEKIEHSVILRTRKDGKIIFVSMSISPIKDAAGNIIGASKIARDITKQKEAEEKINKLNSELSNLLEHVQKSREEERKYIAREIHDELGQRLTALKIDVSMLRKKMVPGETIDPGNITIELNSFINQINKSIKSVKRIAFDLRPEILDHLDIIEAVKWQAQQFQNITGIQCIVSHLPDHLDLENSFSTTVYRTVQEALTNVTRHANASEVRIMIERDSKKLLIEINDNGKGIREEDIESIKSLGLIGMRERVLLLNGTLSITGQPSKGTTVAVNLPI